MNLIERARTAVLGLAFAFLLLPLCGCGTVPRGASDSAQVGATRIQISGAGILKADARGTTFKIKCGNCGFESGELTVPTPLPGKPYVLDWTCPNCGHKQKIVITAVPV